MKQLIQSLVETNGPSGYEGAVRDLIQKEIESLGAETRVDNLGNLIARKGQQSPDGLRVMLSAHMDEIGVIATHIDENGFVRFTTIGGVRVLNHIGGRVCFINGVQGVIGMERMDNANHVPPVDKLFIDVGVARREDCPVGVGDVAVFDRPFVEIGSRLVSKAMDDRVSCAVQIEVMRQLKDSPHEIYYVFSVQEEVGLRGATTAAYGVDPQLGISIDVTMTGDTPKGTRMEVALGKGPAIKVRDGRMLADPRIIRLMEAAAQKIDIPYQLEILEGGTTDAAAIQLTRAGVPSGCVSIPTRYIHSPSEMVDYNDVQNAVKLLVELLSQPIKL